jgi:hypothetical protein
MVQIKKVVVLVPKHKTIRRITLNYVTPSLKTLKIIKAAVSTVMFAAYVNPFL